MFSSDIFEKVDPPPEGGEEGQHLRCNFDNLWRDLKLNQNHAFLDFASFQRSKSMSFENLWIDIFALQKINFKHAKMADSFVI